MHANNTIKLWAILVLIALTQPAHADPFSFTNGLAAWYPLRGDTFDYCGNGNHLQPYTAGKWSSLPLNGSLRPFADTSASLDVMTNGCGYTLSVWIKPSAINGEWSAILEYGDVTTIGPHLFVNDTGAILFTCGYANGFADGEINLWSVDGIVRPKMYMHIVATCDTANNVSVLYTNGVQVAQTSFTPSAGFFTGTCLPLSIGWRQMAGGNLFYGSIDNIRIFNRPLSSSEVASLYATEKKPSPPPTALPGPENVSTFTNPTPPPNH